MNLIDHIKYVNDHLFVSFYRTSDIIQIKLNK